VGNFKTHRGLKKGPIQRSINFGGFPKNPVGFPKVPIPNFFGKEWKYEESNTPFIKVKKSKIQRGNNHTMVPLMGTLAHQNKDMQNVVVIEKNRAHITQGYRRRDYILNKRIFSTILRL